MQQKEQQQVTIGIVVDNHSGSLRRIQLANTTAKVVTVCWGLNAGSLVVDPKTFFKQAYKLETPADADGGDDGVELSSNVM
jgi:hypothetical protein